MKAGLFLFILIISLRGIGAEEVFHPVERWGAHPPVTWQLLSAEPQLTSFSDMEGRAIFQVFTFPQGLYTDVQSLNRAIVSSLNAQAEQAAFTYTMPDTLGALYRGEPLVQTNGLDLSGNPPGGQAEGLFADMQWSSGTLDLRGYGIFLSGGSDALSYGVLAFSLEELFEVYHDFLLSVLDSFHPWLTEESQYLRAPGPVSQFFEDPVPLAMVNGNLAQGIQQTRGNGSVYQHTLALRGDATQVVIDREARILSQFQQAPADLQMDAWRRFYQIIYRDSFADMAGTAVRWFGDLSKNSYDPLTWPGPLLSRLQGFEYRRTGTLADLEAPQIAVLENAGDCDTLVLTYLALLEHAGIDGIIMVSTKHAHSLAGVGSGVAGSGPGANARFPFLGESWLVAELTHPVDLGLIAASMADPADWFGFHLGFRP